MTPQQLFPSALIVLDLCAALVYAWGRDWRHGLYWLAAATLTACVTFDGRV
jgi:hypothetical protein